MKKYMVILPVSAITLFVGLPKGANAQIAVAEVIRAGVKRVIKAVDLRVQRMQNQTVWLQNAQKVLENQLSKLKLTEIADWTQRQRTLYQDYYDELWQVRSAITYYRRIRDLTDRQVAIVNEYRWAWALFQKDSHFEPDELGHMQQVYAGILEESVKNVDQLLMVIHSFTTEMGDAARLEIINTAADKMELNYTDLKKFNRQNIQMSIQRAGSLDEVVTLKELYGIQE